MILYSNMYDLSKIDTVSGIQILIELVLLAYILYAFIYTEGKEMFDHIIASKRRCSHPALKNRLWALEGLKSYWTELWNYYGTSLYEFF